MLYINETNEIIECSWGLIEQYLIDTFNNTETVLKRRYRKPAIRYWNIPAAFDIETTSTYIAGMKAAWMYEWTFGIGKHIFIGRTWDEYIKLINLIALHGCDATLFVGVHNLSFEFQFIRRYFNWDEVFSNDERHPIRAVTGNIEYRCTATISALPLENLAKNLVSHSIRKLKGDLDYSVIRTDKTYLSKAELQYCINDVRILLYYIEEQMEQCGDISKIPLTNTGRVRSYCKEHCLTVIKKDGKKGRNRKYITYIHNQTLTPELYTQCKLAFRGGFTHANPDYIQMELENVTSYDLTSAYPSVMLTEGYPYGIPESVDINKITPDQFEWYLHNRCCLFKVTFTNLMLKEDVPDAYISWNKNKMSGSSDIEPNLNNGRVTQAKELTMWVTEVDYNIIRRCYNYDPEITVDGLTLWFKRYLHKDFVKCILKFYADKTTLKGVKDKVVEYLASKGMLNALYGMLVMDICKDTYVYEDEWDSKPADLDEMIGKYNESAQRFTYYPVGLWVTGYCRKLVWDAILAMGSSYVYSDTDSIKVLGNHDEWFKQKNEEIRQRVVDAMNFHKLDMSLAEPVTIKGDHKLIGVWDNEGTYKRFMTLGAKRYFVEEDVYYDTPIKKPFKPVILHTSKYELTVAGVPKKAVKYLNKFDDPFTKFNFNLTIPASDSCKLTHTYIDTPFTGEITDCQGNTSLVSQLSSVHLEPVDYDFDIKPQFMAWLEDRRASRSK